MMPFKYSKILIIAGWGAYVFAPLLFGPPEWENSGRGNGPMKINMIASLLSIGLFYINFNYLIPKHLLSQKKYFVYLGKLILSVFGMLIVLRLCLFIPGILPNPFDFHGNGRLVIISLPRIIFVSLLAYFVSVNRRAVELEKEKAKAELKQLKAQIAPHFLFNTLNGLYALALTKSDKAGKGIADLAGIMRYIITDAEKERVSLDREINNLTTYIELQKLRLTDQTTIKFVKKGDFKQTQIAPLLLINFVENAFKYGVDTEQESEIEISVEATQNKLIFMVVNDIFAPSPSLSSNKKGIQNAKHRLELIYPGKHLLTVTYKEGKFIVNLTVEL